ncbi:MAG: 50S ribosomal protein L15 [Saprospiraceae bacterium]
MDLSNLRPAEGSVKNRKRIGRGTGSGRGGTSTRGHKGDKARSGAKEKRHFEGGQTPMQRRLPKRGFKNINRVEYAPLNLASIEALIQKTGKTSFDVDALVLLGFSKKSEKIKILGNGKLSSKVDITAHAVSASAKAAIEALGGTVTLV